MTLKNLDTTLLDLDMEALKGVGGQWSNAQSASPISDDLKGIGLFRANLRGACLNGFDLTKTNLTLADLSGANLKGADLNRATLIGANLQGANLSEAKLIKADLTKANLSHSKLTGAELTAYFNRANLHGADLSKANLKHACLLRADLTTAVLDFANLSEADFTGALLENCSMIGVKIDGTIFNHAQVFGINIGDLKHPLETTNQQDLLINRRGPLEITLDGLHVAQSISSLLRDHQIGETYNFFSNAVLILGRFNVERKRNLQSLKDNLRSKDLNPISLDFDRAEHPDLIRVLHTIGPLCQHIILDLTDLDCIPDNLVDVLAGFEHTMVIPVLSKGERLSGTFYNLTSEYNLINRIFEYNSPQKLVEFIDQEMK